MTNAEALQRARRAVHSAAIDSEWFEGGSWASNEIVEYIKKYLDAEFKGQKK
jgi:hypothetical protein